MWIRCRFQLCKDFLSIWDDFLHVWVCMVWRGFKQQLCSLLFPVLSSKPSHFPKHGPFLSLLSAFPRLSGFRLIWPQACFVVKAKWAVCGRSQSSSIVNRLLVINRFNLSLSVVQAQRSDWPPSCPEISSVITLLHMAHNPVLACLMASELLSCRLHTHTLPFQFHLYINSCLVQIDFLKGTVLPKFNPK